jgi:hypothetical protein
MTTFLEGGFSRLNKLKTKGMFDLDWSDNRLVNIPLFLISQG